MRRPPVFLLESFGEFSGECLGRTVRRICRRNCRRIRRRIRGEFCRTGRFIVVLAQHEETNSRRIPPTEN
eukprot:689876-Lingulodinium_polyedra.AAC.1